MKRGPKKKFTAEQLLERERERQRERYRRTHPQKKHRPGPERHLCTGCDQPGHNIRTCKHREAAA